MRIDETGMWWQRRRMHLVDYPTPRMCGVLVRRYKRFFVDIRLDSGEEVTAHTANTGAMTGMSEPGQRVLVSFHDNPKRKLKYSLQAVHDGETWIGANPILSNRVAAEILKGNHVESLAGYPSFQSEVKVERAGEVSRLDAKLSGHPTDVDAFVEVKSATLRRGKVALFPDAVTARGKRHVELLTTLAQEGVRAVLMLLVQRADCERFVPAWDVDPAYCEALLLAEARGVEVIAIEIVVDENGIDLGRQLPVSLARPKPVSIARPKPVSIARPKTA